MLWPFSRPPVAENGGGHDGVKALGRIKQVVEPLRVMRCDRKAQHGEQFSPAGVDLVRLNRTPDSACEHGEVARPGTRLKHAHSGPNRCRRNKNKRLGGRRAELLKLDLPLVAA